MYHLSKLANGINLITVPMQGTSAATIMTMFPVGSRYEEKNISGASHFLEHMLFKGTQKRPTHLEISRDLDAVGAEYNAFTSKDCTAYHARVDANKLELAFDWLADIVFNSKIDGAELEKEKGVIIEEMRMYEDNPIMAVDLLFEKTVFGDCPLGWDIVGNHESISGFTREHLLNYYQTHYLPQNLILVVAGKIDKIKLKKCLRHFSVIKPRAKNNIKFEKFTWNENVDLEKRIGVSERKVDQEHVIIGFPAFKNNHPDRYAVAVLLNILGGSMSSRLFVEVREKRGLAYMINAGSDSYQDAGVAYVRAGLDPSRLPEAIKVIKQELQKIQTELVSPSELADAKNNLSGKTTLGMEDSASQAIWFAKQFIFADKMETYQQTIVKIKKVTANDVRRVAKKFFDWNKMRMGAVGPVTKEELLKMIKPQ